MAYCDKCGKRLADGAVFCSKCGAPVTHVSDDADTGKRAERYDGVVHKCPNCGAPVGSFDAYCSACGNELRDKEAADSVVELSRRLDQIESERNESGKKKDLFARAAEQNAVSDIDQRKISLIRTYPIPNTVEDILEFVILASSNADPGAFSSLTPDVSRKAVSEAWVSKCEQAIRKAEVSFSGSPLVGRMNEMLETAREKVGRAKRRRVFAQIALYAGPWLLLLGLIGILVLTGALGPGAVNRERERLDGIVESIEQDLDDGEYLRALLKADSLETEVTDDMAQEWEINREYWIDRVLNVAFENGVDLSARASELDGGQIDFGEGSSTGFLGGFMDGLGSGQEEMQENVDEFNRIMSGD